MGLGLWLSGVLGLVICLFIMLVAFLLDKGKAMPENTLDPSSLTREFADTTPERRFAVYHLWKIGQKLKKSRTLLS